MTSRKIEWSNKIKKTLNTKQFTITTTTKNGITNLNYYLGIVLDLSGVEPRLAVFTRQKLTHVSFNPGRT